MQVIRFLLIVLLAIGCAGCDPISKTQVAIDSPTAMGVDCAVRALRANGFSLKGAEGPDVAVQAGDIFMGLHARQGGYDIYVSKVGKPNTCAEIEQFAPYMKRAVKVISTQCSGQTSPTTRVDLPREDCGIRVDG